MKRIENWSVTLCPRNPYLAPELRPQCLQGICEGQDILTSPIVSASCDETIWTMNTEYELGEVDPEYEAEYPNARGRLFSSLRSFDFGASNV